MAFAAVLRRIVLAAGLLAATVVHAQYGWTMRDANVRAGPAREYPLVAWLPLGTVVYIVGCVEGWRWCEVAHGDARGFMYAGFLAYPYGDGYVVVRDAGPSLGLPLVGFDLLPYWGTWYFARPWYVDRDWWAHRPVHRPPWHAPAQPPTVHPRPPVPPIGAVPRMTHPAPPLRVPPPPGPHRMAPPEPPSRPAPGRPPGSK
ncbi:MAG TPA: SH3 domain-containing protein [Casimicrobiaceae bacterium]|nr:SH3 domain-containing protein [Casimicrobiaceae bacterium]